MDKKSIAGIALVAILFLGFAFYNSREQQRYERQMAEWQAYQDSLAAASQSLQTTTLPDFSASAVRRMPSNTRLSAGRTVQPSRLSASIKLAADGST